jgi:hypothetical protein
MSSVLSCSGSIVDGVSALWAEAGGVEKVITALAMLLDRSHYSVYEPESATVTAQVTPTGDEGDEYTVTIKKKTAGADRTLATQTIILGAGDSDVPKEVAFDLASLTTADGFMAARTSKLPDDYRVEAEGDGVTKSKPFTVVPITADHMRDDFLLGLLDIPPAVRWADFADPKTHTLVHEILRTAAYAERKIFAFLEPTEIVSRILLQSSNPPTVYDVIGEPVAYYRQANLLRWLNVKIPYSSLLKVKSLIGFFNRERVVEIADDWITFNTRSGEIELVPSNAATINWVFYGPGFYTLFVNFTVVPNFWNFHIIAGLREMPVPIIEWIGKRAAMNVLTNLGHSRNPEGITSLSISRDGVSESRSVNPKGLYDATIQRYREDTGLDSDGKERGLREFRELYVGMPFVTL